MMMKTALMRMRGAGKAVSSDVQFAGLGPNVNSVLVYSTQRGSLRVTAGGRDLAAVVDLFAGDQVGGWLFVVLERERKTEGVCVFVFLRTIMDHGWTMWKSTGELERARVMLAA